LARRDKHEDAVAEYSEAIRLAPGNPDNLNDRGWSLIKIEQYDRAIADFTEAIRIKPDHVHAWQNRGWAYWLKGDLDKALADLDQAVSLDPDNLDPRLDRAAVLDDKGELNESIAAYNKILAVAPDEALNGRAWRYAQKGELDKALDDSERAVLLLKDEANALHTRAWIYMNRGQLDAALADYDRALGIDPRHEAGRRCGARGSRRNGTLGRQRGSPLDPIGGPARSWLKDRSARRCVTDRTKAGPAAGKRCDWRAARRPRAARHEP
jgi:tetratricopeptide (TPR) repeat protein